MTKICTAIYLRYPTFAITIRRKILIEIDTIAFEDGALEKTFRYNTTVKNRLLYRHKLVRKNIVVNLEGNQYQYKNNISLELGRKELRRKDMRKKWLRKKLEGRSF